MPPRPVLGAVALVCLVLAVGCFTTAWRSAGHRHLVAFSAPVPLTDGPTSASSAPPAPVRTSRPVRIAVPAVALSARVVPVGLSRSGRLEMPPPSAAGWYRRGSGPAEPGPAVLVGHVDSHDGPAVFYRLSGVRVGDAVELTRADGSTSRFAISRITVVSRADFPTRAVYGPNARADLRLITCTGAFDASTGYADSLIIWAHPTPF